MQSSVWPLPSEQAASVIRLDLAEIHLGYSNQIDSLLQIKVQLLESRIKDLTIKATGKLHGLDSISNTHAASFLDKKLDLDPEQYSTQLTEINQSLESYTSQITDKEELKWVEHYSGQLDQLEGVIEKYKGKLMDLDELQQLKGYRQQLEQLSGEASGYFRELQNISSGEFSDNSPLMKQLESKIGNYPQFLELKKQSAALEEIKNRPDEYQGKLKELNDPKQVQTKAKELVNHFAQNQDKLKAAQDKLATLKKKYSSIQSTKDMSTAVKRNSLEGKSLSERLVLGGNFQINPGLSKSSTTSTASSISSGNTNTSKVPTAVDISLLLGYKLNKKFTLGIGATYRATLELDNFKSNDQVYGYRGFIQQEVIKSFFVHAEYESLSTSGTTVGSSDKVSRSWKPGGLLGVGKEFSFFKQVTGQVMVLYNLLHEDGASPYRKPWVIRFGFNIEGLKGKTEEGNKLSDH